LRENKSASRSTPKESIKKCLVLTRPIREEIVKGKRVHFW